MVCKASVLCDCTNCSSCACLEDINKLSDVQIIVTRHDATKKLLQKLCPNATLLEQATIESIKGKIVAGTLPIQLISVCQTYFHVSLDIPREFRGTEFSEEDLIKFNFKLEKYKAYKI